MPTIIFDLDGTLLDLGARDEAGNIRCYANREMTERCASFTRVLVTGAARAQAATALKETGLDELMSFTEIVCAEEGGNNKASGKPFKKIQERFGTCAVIGDSDSDEQGARAAGCLFERVHRQASPELQTNELLRCVKSITSQLK